MSKYPVAERSHSGNASSAVACVHCGTPIAFRRWDRLNGFLVECPNCHGYNGKRWNPRTVAIASLFFNALSFFFTMRPARAAMATVVWVAAMALLLPRVEYAPDWLQASAFGLLFLGPVLINMALLVRHHIELDRHPVAARSVSMS